MKETLFFKISQPAVVAYSIFSLSYKFMISFPHSKSDVAISFSFVQLETGDLSPYTWYPYPYKQP